MSMRSWSDWVIFVVYVLFWCVLVVWMSVGIAATVNVGGLRPGDTLTLLDGTYEPLSITCGGNARSGAPGQPITVRAAHERQASFQSDGGAAIRIRGCQHWVLHGLVAGSRDVNNSGDEAVVMIEDSSQIELKRLVVHHPNRFNNVPAMLLSGVSGSLVEESEFYSFHRNGLSTKYGVGNIFRRNYFNSRGAGDVGGGVDSGTEGRGDTALTIYPGSGHILENNISEGNAAAWDIQAVGPSVGNRILGQISLKDTKGAVLHARGVSAEQMPQGTLIEHFVVINPSTTGLYARSSKETRCRNCSVFGGQTGLLADRDAHPGDGQPSFYAENILVMQNRSAGLYVIEQAAWGVQQINAYQNGTNFVPDVPDPHITGARSVNPNLGDCKLWIPDGSPLKGTGTDGKDVGASLVMRYEHGQLTQTPLWTAQGFPCGAIVPGINDVAGASCRDVHQRLGVGVEGCVPPLFFGPGVPVNGPLPPPRNVRLIRR